MTTLYQPIVTGVQVRDALTATIQAWANAYTDEVGRQHSVTLPPIRTYGVSLGMLPTGEVADELPACVVVAPGIAGDPVRRGTGDQDATWAVGVGVVVADLSADPALDLAALYAAAVRALLVQHGSLGGFARGTTWLDEEYVEVAYERDRVVAAGNLKLEVEVAAVVNRFGGPTVPPVDPTVPLPTVAVATTSVDLRRLT